MYIFKITKVFADILAEDIEGIVLSICPVQRISHIPSVLKNLNEIDVLCLNKLSNGP